MADAQPIKSTYGSVASSESASCPWTDEVPSDIIKEEENPSVGDLPEQEQQLPQQKREKEGGGRIGILDGYRGLACMAVLLYHYTTSFRKQYGFGNITDDGGPKGGIEVPWGYYIVIYVYVLFYFFVIFPLFTIFF